MANRTAAVCFSLAAMSLLAGCGGGGGGHQTTTTNAKFTIDWAARSRAIQAPSAALSATVTFIHASTNGSDVSMTVDRRTDPAAYSQTYTTTSLVRTGSYTMSVQFYSQAGGSGSVVGSGEGTTTIQSDGNSTGSITTDSTITSVVVDPGQTVATGGTHQLTFSARDSNNAIVAVSPGSAVWTLIDGNASATLTQDGVLSGVQAGTVHVEVSVNGVSSQSTAVAVTAPPDFQDPSFEQANVPTGQWLENVDVTGTPWSGDPNWGIADGSGSWGTNGHSGSQYAFVQASTFEGNVPGALKQTISGLTVGETYRVTLWISRRNGNVGGNTGAPINVFANGAKILGPVTPQNTGNWEKLTTSSFTATQSTYDFKIQSVLPVSDDTSTLVDDVHLESVP